jgi:CPA1 family monovalent cation:H+ antiporter
MGMTTVLRWTRERFPYTWGLAVTWGGLRGALPMVLALSLPSGFAHRELIINMTFGVVMLFILGHGLSMPPLLRGLGIVRQPEERWAHELARGRARAFLAVLAELDRMQGAGPVMAEMLEPLRRDYQTRLDQAHEEIRQIHLRREEIRREEFQRLQHHLILTEKHQLLETFREGLIGLDAYRELQADADARLLELDSQESQSPPPPPERDL